MIRPNVMNRRLKLAKELARKNGGKLPNPWKMIQQGHGGLYRYIRRHPVEFKKFIVEEAVIKAHKNKGKFNISIREEHIKTAQNLAKANGGVIPNSRWLIKHGYTRLASYLRTYPHIFGDLLDAN